nr:hypothetical protein X990_3960 [Burkholderia pseudomallei MSHR4868]
MNGASGRDGESGGESGMAVEGYPLCEPACIAAGTGSQVRTPAITGARVRVSLAARAGGIPRRRCRMSRGALASAAGFRPPAGGEA